MVSQYCALSELYDSKQKCPGKVWGPCALQMAKLLPEGGIQRGEAV